jgi:hypothetical protein
LTFNNSAIIHLGDWNWRSIMTRETESLESRVVGLERQNRRWKCIGIGVFALVLATTVWGQGESNRLVLGERFELRDVKGRVRAELAMLEGRPAMRFFDEDGNVKSIAVEDDLVYFKKSGDLLASYGSDELRLEDGHGKTFANLRGDGREGATLLLSTAGGKSATVVNAMDLAKLGKTTSNSPSKH